MAVDRSLNMDKNLLLLLNYVNAATDLAESVEANMATKNKKLTSETIVAVSRFRAAAERFQKIIDQLHKTNVKLN